MGKLVVLAAILFVVVIPLLVVLLRRQPLAAHNPADRNHLAMARWIERQVGDDMVRVSLPPDQRALANVNVTPRQG